MASAKHKRHAPEGAVPLIDVEGSAVECGRYLGHVWAEPIRLFASRCPAQSRSFWKDKRFRKLVSKHAPHLPDLHQAMAKAAGVSEDQVGARAPAEDSGCTSFAIQPRAAQDGIPISGQTKDTPVSRIFQYQVLRMKMSDAPSALTLTYEGWLFGHGFVQGGCSIFRNSLYAGDGDGQLPYPAWGLLALHCESVDQVVQMTRDYGVAFGFHATVADEHGGIVGIEVTRNGTAFLRPKRGIYSHANAVLANKRSAKHEKCGPLFKRKDSLHRQKRLYDRLTQQRGRLTSQLALIAMVDHDGYPTSLCRHQGPKATTGAAVVVEPTRGALHVTRGPPCQNWPHAYRL